MENLTAFKSYKTDSNIDLHICKNTKFKTNLIEIYFLLPLKEETVNLTALLPYVLYRGSKAFPTSRDYEKRLEELYGADLGVSVLKRGEIQLIKFSLELVNERFLPDKEPLLDKALKLLHELIFHPLMLTKYIDQEREFIKKEISSLINDKYSYAVERCNQEMCKNEPYGLYKLGSITGLDNITETDLLQFYQQLLAKSQLKVLTVGAISETELLDKVNQHFKFQHQQVITFNQTKIIDRVDQVQEVIDHLRVQQGKLVMGFRTGITRRDRLYYALMFYNGILGSFSHSKLFLNVREKASLAYFVNSHIESTKGLLEITSGIDTDDYIKARELIIKEVERMASGEISQNEFDWTKKGLINRLQSSADHIRGLSGHYLLGLINNQPDSINEMIKKLNEVTLDEVIEVAQRVKLDTIYFMDKKVEK